MENEQKDTIKWEFVEKIWDHEKYKCNYCGYECYSWDRKDHKHIVFEPVNLDTLKAIYENKNVGVFVAENDYGRSRIIDLSTIAKHEDFSFVSYFPKEYYELFGIALKSNQLIVGYCVWNYYDLYGLSLREYENEIQEDNQKPAIRQIFIRKGFRGQGLGSILLKETAQYFAKDRTIYAEDPNPAGIALLKKCGFDDAKVIRIGFL